jgi:uncharacterized repeat protein (TIGR01451 family)
LLRLDREHLGGARLRGVRVLSSGLAFLVCAFLLGRVAEGLAPGCGGATLVAFALGTLAAPFAAAGFGHLAAATLGFGAFLLAWNRRHLLAGVLDVYVALRGLRSLARCALGVAPGVALLLAYDAIAFGAPWHLSYRYIANGFVFAQNEGVFGVGAPKSYSSYEVFSGAGSPLVRSLAGNALTWLGSGRILAAGIAAVAGAAALVLGFRSLPRGAPWSGRAAVVVLASLAAVAVADASALAARPYRNHVVIVPSLLYTRISASSPVALPGDEVDFTTAVENPEPANANEAVLRIELPSGLRLLGPPSYENGSGCTGRRRSPAPSTSCTRGRSRRCASGRASFRARRTSRLSARGRPRAGSGHA